MKGIKFHFCTHREVRINSTCLSINVFLGYEKYSQFNQLPSSVLNLQLAFVSGICFGPYVKNLHPDFGMYLIA